MRFRFWGAALVAAALACTILAVSGAAPAAGGLTAFFSFPFAQTGGLLRSLSLAGAWGNVTAVGLYAALSLVPLVFFFRRLARKRARPEDALLVVMCAYLFFMLYYLVNPSFLGRLFSGVPATGESFARVGGPILGGAFYSILIGYLALGLLRKIDCGETERMLTWLQRLLYVGVALLIFSIFYLGIHGLVSSLRELRAANTDPQVSPALTYAFLVLRFGLDQLPASLGLGLLILAVKLAEALKKDRFGEEAVAAAARLAKLCKTTVAATVLSAIAANLLQLIFGRWLLNTDFTASAPVSLLVLTLVLLVMAQYFAESSALHRDNQLFI